MILAVGALTGEHLVHRHIHALAPLSFSLKNQGVALQQSAFARPDLLPLYGSSELIKPIPDKAARFFRRYPTNFEVFPVGKAGTTSLIILQKLAGVGSDAARTEDRDLAFAELVSYRAGPDSLLRGKFLEAAGR